MRHEAKSLPVLMYHYISRQEDSIAVSPEFFEEHCRVLADAGKRGVGLAEAEAFLRHGEPLPKGSVLITFDDGYYDNYLHALPILARYGHKGVMFMVSARTEEGDIPRVALADVLAGNAVTPETVDFPVRADALGYTVRQDVFCNRGELRVLEASGVMAVASHSRGHLGVFTGPEYTGFIRPGDQRRTFYRTESPALWGLPAFRVKAGLQFRAFIPSPELLRVITDLVPQDYAAADTFFKDSANEACLRAAVQALAGNLGRMETEAEGLERMRREIAGGKAELEAVLGKPVTSLCWPWGRYNDQALALGREAGFSIFFTTQEGVNLPGAPLCVRRFKAKNQSGAWLLSRVRLYERPMLGALYAKIRM